MGRRAGSLPCPFRRKSPWQAALLAASILNSCFQAQGFNWVSKIPVTWEPSQPFKGGGVTLTPGGTLNFLFCSWYRGDQVDKAKWIFTYIPSPKQQNGPAHTGRETGGRNCSLHIRSLTSDDTGNYTVSKSISSAASEIGGAYIKVLGPRRLERSTINLIVAGALSVAVLIGLLLYCFICGCFSYQVVLRSPRFSLRPLDIEQRRHTPPFLYRNIIEEQLKYKTQVFEDLC